MHTYTKKISSQDKAHTTSAFTLIPTNLLASTLPPNEEREVPLPTPPLTLQWMHNLTLDNVAQALKH